MTWDAWADAEAAQVRAAGQWRAPRDLDAAGPAGTLAPDGRAVVQFASNDYLGLTQHPEVVAAAHDALDRWGSGAGAARLIVGSRPVHSELDRALATWKRTESAVLFPTGFATNLGVLTTFAGPDVLVCSDELNHASIIDGTRLARAEVAVYPHRDLDALDALLAGRARGRRVLVVTDTVFSMDGDLADVDATLAVCARHDALLVVDEAHAVLGPDLIVPPDAPVLRVGTLSKTLGALGGFVAGPRRLTDLVVNRARPYIFTTASTPADAAAALAAVEIVQGQEGDDLRARLRANVDLLREGHPSPIVPVPCGDEQRALDLAAALLDRGLLVPAIRPPTVPAGTARLRIALSAAHTLDQVRTLRAALDELSMTIVFVTGTGTEVGKTWVLVRLLAGLRDRGHHVAARKPAQSFAPGELGTTDAELLAAVTDARADTVCPAHRWYATPMAPPMAAAALGLPPFGINDLVRELDVASSAGAASIFVEGAGGPRSPLAADGDNVDLARAVGAQLAVLVADAGLGTINAVRLSVDAFTGFDLLVVLNRFEAREDLHRRNRDWLVAAGYQVLTSVEALLDVVEERLP